MYYIYIRINFVVILNVYQNDIEVIILFNVIDNRKKLVRRNCIYYCNIKECKELNENDANFYDDQINVVKYN